MDKSTDIIKEMTAEIDRLSELSWIVQDINRLMTKTFDARAKEVGFTRSQWRVLYQLLKSGGCTQTELADLVQIEKAPLGRMLDKLEDAGWIFRERDAGDRRIRRVYPSSKLEPYIPAMRETTREVLEVALDPLTDGEEQDLLTTLGKIKVHLTACVSDTRTE